MIIKIFTKNNKGFTLIELLVVISIIGLLSSVVLASLNSARSKARDAKRKADLHQIEIALALYYDKYGTYPAAGVVCNPGVNEHGDGWCRNTTNNNGITPIVNWIPGLQEFLSPMPQEPQPYYSSGWFPYHYTAPNANQYWLMVALENTADKSACGGGAVYYWFDNVTNTCGWWGVSLYARKVQ